MIKLTDQVIRQKYKPSGKDFDLRATGQLLLLTPFKEKKHSGYKEFHDMNDMALAKYELPYSTRCFMVSFISTLK